MVLWQVVGGRIHVGARRQARPHTLFQMRKNHYTPRPLRLERACLTARPCMATPLILLVTPPARRLKTSVVPVNPNVVPEFTGTALVQRGAVEWGCTAGQVAGTGAMKFWKAKLC